MQSHFKTIPLNIIGVAISLATACIFTSCERQQVVDIDVPQKSKLFAAAFIGEQDSFFKVYVSRSIPVLGAEQTDPNVVIPDATVTIGDGTNIVSLNYDAEVDYYVSPLNTFRVTDRKQYQVTVSQNGEQSTGLCKLPNPVVSNVEIAVDSIFDTTNAEYKYEANVIVSVESPGTNYILVSVFMDYGFDIPIELNESAQQKVLQVSQGQQVTLNFKQNLSLFGIKPTRFVVYVYSTEESFYKYHEKAGKFDFSTFFPFAEPSFIYSNMSSGIGIVSAYRLSKVSEAPIP